MKATLENFLLILESFRDRVEGLRCSGDYQVEPPPSGAVLAEPDKVSDPATESSRSRLADRTTAEAMAI